MHQDEPCCGQAFCRLMTVSVREHARSSEATFRRPTDPNLHFWFAESRIRPQVLRSAVYVVITHLQIFAISFECQIISIHMHNIYSYVNERENIPRNNETKYHFHCVASNLHCVSIVKIFETSKRGGTERRPFFSQLWYVKTTRKI